MTKTRKHRNCNCFLFAVICHAMVEGWLLDVNKIRAYTLEQLTREICNVDNLEEKPKVVLVEEYGGSNLLSLAIYLQITSKIINKKPSLHQVAVVRGIFR